jgi:putative acetyltransferase
MISIRDYRESDKEEVYFLIDNIIHEIFSSKLSDADDLSDINQHYYDRGGAFYVALDQGKIVGTIGIFLMDDGKVKIKRMYVDKDYRKQGIGQELLDKIMAFCETKRYTDITLTTYPQMSEAIRFYERNGFKHVDTKATGGLIMIYDPLYKKRLL